MNETFQKIPMTQISLLCVYFGCVFDYTRIFVTLIKLTQNLCTRLQSMTARFPPPRFFSESEFLFLIMLVQMMGYKQGQELEKGGAKQKACFAPTAKLLQFASPLFASPPHIEQQKIGLQILKKKCLFVKKKEARINRV